MNLSEVSKRLLHNYFSKSPKLKSCWLCIPTAFTYMNETRYYCTKKNYEPSITETTKRSKLKNSTGVAGSLNKYKLFKDYDGPVILDIDEERQLRLDHPELLELEDERPDEFSGMNVERGLTGVFDIEELVDVLRKDNAQNIVTISIPPEAKYVDYMVIVSGRSQKHLYAMAVFIRKLFKRKRHDYDRIPIIEGSTSKQGKYSNWLAMDLGNIVLHFFIQEIREKYDLETLWSVGAEYDDIFQQKEDQYISLLRRHTHSSLDDLVPLEESAAKEKKIA